MLKLPPKKTIPVCKIFDPYFLVKNPLGSLYNKAKSTPRNKDNAEFPIHKLIQRTNRVIKYIIS